MKKTTTGTAALGVLAALAWAPSLQGHHSGSMYDTTPVWVQGTVIRFEAVDPHTITTVEARSADGQVRRWAVEGPGQSQLDRLGIGTDVPRVGDTIEVCAFPYKSVAELSRLFPGVDFSTRRAALPTDGSAPRFVAGHVTLTPDGRKRVWEPHGVIGECIRSSDEQRQSWLDFLDTDPRARQLWCEQRRYAHVQSTASLKEFIEGINRSMDNPCE